LEGQLGGAVQAKIDYIIIMLVTIGSKKKKLNLFLIY